MTTTNPYRDCLYRLVQAGSPAGIQLVRIQQAAGGNRYQARPIEFDDNGQTVYAEQDSITVTNLAEPADGSGQVPADTDAVGLDVEGRWVVFIRQAGTAMFPARVVSSQGDATYNVREQSIDAGGALGDKSGTADVQARNLAELSLGPGAALDVGTVVLVVPLADGATPPNVRYFFDHPAYAKYLD